jgi:hypothetical protein
MVLAEGGTYGHYSCLELTTHNYGLVTAIKSGSYFVIDAIRPVVIGPGVMIQHGVGVFGLFVRMTQTKACLYIQHMYMFYPVSSILN